MTTSAPRPPDAPADAGVDATQDAAVAPACVLTFNAADPSGAGGLAGDVSTLAAMGAHALPITTSILLRDTAEIFDHHPIDADVVAEQARTVLEDITVSGWKVGFLGSAEGVSAVAEILADNAAGTSDRPLHESLSERELQVFLRLAKGETVGNIAESMFLSIKTVSTYRTRVMEKLKLQSNSDLTYYALKNGLIQ